MPTFPGTRLWCPFNVLISSTPPLASFVATSQLTDIGQDDQTTGEIIAQSVTLPGLSCPRPNLQYSNGLQAAVDLGVSGLTLRGNRFTYRTNPRETSPVYCGGGGASTHTIQWVLFTTNDFLNLDVVQNGGASAPADNEFHTHVQNHPGYLCKRYLLLKIATVRLWVSPQSGTFTHDIYLSDWGASDEEFEDEGDGEDPCDDPPGAVEASGEAQCCGREHVLTWTPSVGAVGYRVYEGVALLYEGMDVTYTRDLTAAQQKADHTYLVLAYNDCGESATDSVTIQRYHRRGADPTTSYGRGSDPACNNSRVAGVATVYRRGGCD